MMSLGDRRREKRRALKFGVRNRVIPHLRALGFEQTRIKANRERWSRLGPWIGDHGRKRGEEADFIDIYWDKYGSPKFKFFLTVLKGGEVAYTGFAGTVPELHSGYYGLPWGLLGFGGVWFGPGQSAEAAIDLALHRLSELDRALQEADAVAMTKIVDRGYVAVAPSPAAWWLRHFRTDLPELMNNLYGWIYRPTGSARP